ncbi:hypothetical protein V8E53_010995 [Lactarius tabidus]
MWYLVMCVVGSLTLTGYSTKTEQSWFSICQSRSIVRNKFRCKELYGLICHLVHNIGFKNKGKKPNSTLCMKERALIQLGVAPAVTYSSEAATSGGTVRSDRAS